MAFTTEQLTALETAISSGQLSVRFNGREIRYQSTKEMIWLRDRMRGELGLNTQENSRSRGGRVTFTVGKGL
jgi:hypothetical protein